MVVEHQVVVSLTVSGDVSEYGPASNKAISIRQALATQAGVHISAVSLTVTAASVRIEATIRVADSSAASSLESAVSTAMKSKEAATALLGVAVLSTPSVSKQAVVVAVSPPPQPPQGGGGGGASPPYGGFQSSPPSPGAYSYGGGGPYSYGGGGGKGGGGGGFMWSPPPPRPPSPPPSPPPNEVTTQVALHLGIPTLGPIRASLLGTLAQVLQMHVWDLSISRVLSSSTSSADGASTTTVLVRVTEHFGPACDVEPQLGTVATCSPVQAAVRRLIASNACTPSPPPPPPPSAPSVCNNRCMFSWDMSCDDGGPGAKFSVCGYGSDCQDCGPRPLVGYSSPNYGPVPPPGWSEPKPLPPSSFPPVGKGAMPYVSPPSSQSPIPIPPPIIPPPPAPLPPPAPGSECQNPTIAWCLNQPFAPGATDGIAHCLALSHNASLLPLATGGPSRLLATPLEELSLRLSTPGLSVPVLNTSIPCGDGRCDRYEQVPADRYAFMYGPHKPSYDSVCYADCGCGDGYCDQYGDLGRAAGGFPAETAASCPEDCACGDGVCSAEHGETLRTCPQDCTCGNGMCENWCTAEELERRKPGWWTPDDIRPSCNETVHTCGEDCHCGDGVCDPLGWGEDNMNCGQDCYCGDGVCSSQHENWLSCSLDCSPLCGNGVCECTSTGNWGDPLCCFGDSSFCQGNAALGPETPTSCPFDCGAPCPPFCDAAVCADGLIYYPAQVEKYEVQYRDVGVAASGSLLSQGMGGMGGMGAMGLGGTMGGFYGDNDLGSTYSYEQSLPPPPPTASPWQTLVATSGALTASLRELVPSTIYEVRVRAGNGAGWGEWSDSKTFETTGLPEGGACLQDDAPCGMDGSGRFADVSYTYHGLGCEAPPVVTVLGGNCLEYANATGANATANATGGATGRRLQAGGGSGSGDWGSGDGFGSGSGDDYGSGSGESGGSIEASTECEAGCARCGANAVVEAVVVDGLVMRLNVLSGGSDYSSVPTVSFSGGNCTLQPQAFAELSASGAVSAVNIYTPCISPGGSMQGRMNLRGADFASKRTEVKYDNYMHCGWRVKPSVIPSGYKLRLSFEHLNTERGLDIVALLDGDGGDAFSQLSVYDFYGGVVPQHLSHALTPLSVSSGNTPPPARLSESETALLLWSTDGSVTKPGGFVFRYELQALQPPDKPDAVSVDLNMVTRTGSFVSWVAPSSPVPILWYRLRVRSAEEDVGGDGAASGAIVAEEIVSSAQLGAPLQDLSPGSRYEVTLQAWTEAVEPSKCTGGESSLCSEWSAPSNFTTRTLATLWHISPTGSYLYGDGSLGAPFPMDVQGVIDDSRVLNGAELVLAPGTYSLEAMRGPGSAVDLNLRGKVLTIRSRSGDPADTVFDCGGRRRLLTFNHSEPPSVVLSGVTVRNCGGDADGRGALWITGGARPRVINCTFVDNAAERGGAFVADAGAAPTFEGCAFRGNNATSGCPCSLAKRRDATCDAECSSRACGWDYAGGCCPSACELGWGDGICVGICNIPACGCERACPPHKSPSPLSHPIARPIARLIAPPLPAPAPPLPPSPAPLPNVLCAIHSSF